MRARMLWMVRTLIKVEWFKHVALLCSLAALNACGGSAGGSTAPTPAPTTYVLTVAVNGSGSVSSAPAGIVCGAVCSNSFNAGSNVALTATPATGYTFSGWGGACSGTGTCTVAMSATRSVTASFTATPGSTFALNVALTGSGTVTSSPSGINCGVTCSATYSQGIPVTLTAAPAMGSSFTGWNGSCTGNSLTCTLTMSAARSVTAGFDAVVVTPPGTGTFYLSPTGSNSADCKSQGAPCKTFAYVFSKMAAGDELVLLDGVYSSVVGTGSMHWNDGANSAQIPSGTAARSTYVHALNPGKVTVQGELFVGRSNRKDSYITVRGLTFEGGMALYNTSFVTIKEVGVHGAMDIGTGDHTQGNTDNLIEDVWVWAAEQRVIAINYRADRNVWRRVVVRGDGCYAGDCLNSGAPNVGITVYESRDVSLQNVIVVDRILSPDAINAGNRYADFATAQHTSTASLYLGRNEWLGCISLNAPDSGFQFEADDTIPSDPTWTLKNVVAIGSNIDGINVGHNGRVVINNATAVNSALTGDGLRIAPESVGTSASNIIVKGFSRGLNSSLTPSYTDTFGSTLLYNQTTPSVGVHTANPTADGPTPSLQYITRIETGSALKGAGAGGADIGANVFYRYGADGTRYGAANVNTLTTTVLWPWPNEERIKREMCASTTRGFCSTGKRLDGINPISLTSYIWEALGNAVPADIY